MNENFFGVVSVSKEGGKPLIVRRAGEKDPTKKIIPRDDTKFNVNLTAKDAKVEIKKMSADASVLPKGSSNEEEKEAAEALKKLRQEFEGGEWRKN